MKLGCIGCLALLSPMSGAWAQVRPISDAAFQDTLRTGMARSLDKNEAAGGKAAVAAAPARPAQDPCAQNRQVESRQYRFQLASPSQAQPVTVTFRYAGECTVIDRGPDGDPITPIASRRFTGDNGAYDLYINTELDATDSSLSITQSPDGPGTFLNAASLEDQANRNLLNGTVQLGNVRLMDWRVPRGSETRGTATLEITASR